MNRLETALLRTKLSAVRIGQRFSVLRHGVWFVDIPRTSTKSISAELVSAFGPVYRKSRERWTIPEHSTALYMRSHLGEFVWNRIFKFTVVRNPFSRHLSYYLWARGNGYFEDITYPEFVLELRKQVLDKKSRFVWHGPWYSNLDYLTDEDGKLIVDSIVKFEDRKKGLAEVAKKIGLKDLGATHLNKHMPDEQHYSEYYDDQSVEIIAELYQRDLEHFGYEFERPAHAK